MPELTTILFIIIAFLLVVIYLAYKLAIYKTNLAWQKRLPHLQKLTADRQRATIKGHVAETFAPFLPEFPFKPSESKFIGDPIDYIVFEGLDERNIKAIHFVEIKNNSAKMSKHQKQIKNLVDNLNSEDITFREARFDDKETSP